MLVRVIVAAIIIGVIVWGVEVLLPLAPIGAPFKTVLWVVIVIAAVISFVQIAFGTWRWPWPPNGPLP